MTKQTKDVQTVIDELAKRVLKPDAMANFYAERWTILFTVAIAALDKHMYFKIDR